MLEAILFLTVGAFVGWNFPQPWWAKILQQRVKDWLNKQ
jgi:hypothetical protein